MCSDTGLGHLYHELCEEMRWPLQRSVQLPLIQVRYNNGNRIDCSCGAVFARWRGLGILSLAQLANTGCCLTLLDPVSWSLWGFRSQTVNPFHYHFWVRCGTASESPTPACLLEAQSSIYNQQSKNRQFLSRFRESSCSPVDRC
jgi:hypothetical protein